jgi:hypothetical protein
MISYNEHLFISAGHLHAFIGRMSFRSFAFYVYLFLLWSCMYSLYIFGINLLLENAV